MRRIDIRTRSTVCWRRRRRRRRRRWWWWWWWN
jgi:hypothetical protein